MKPFYVQPAIACVLFLVALACCETTSGQQLQDVKTSRLVFEKCERGIRPTDQQRVRDSVFEVTAISELILNKEIAPTRQRIPLWTNSCPVYVDANPLARRLSTNDGFAGLDFANRPADIHRHGSGLWVRHQPPRPKHLAEFAHKGHYIRGRDDRIEFRPAFLDLVGKVLGPDMVGADVDTVSATSEPAAASEPGGYFDTDNLISNESSYLQVVPELRRAGISGGAYLGVGPDQNFTYIAEIRPAIAFIVDIRRDNLLLHLLFKALFQLRLGAKLGRGDSSDMRVISSAGS